jgi:hypothetical protein
MTREHEADSRSWARAKCEEVVRTCRITAVDGTTLFTPDGVGHYGAMWTRDFAYLVEHGGEFLEQAEVRAAIEVLVSGQRADGAIPDRVNAHLVPIYFPGAVKGAINAGEALTMLQKKDPLALRGPMGIGPALDNPMFMVSLVYHYHRLFRDGEFVQAALPALRRGLDWVPRNRGLVFNDPQRPSCTYGFQDNVAKGGHDLFCSLLYVVACRQMAEMAPSEEAYWRGLASSAEQNLVLLWDDERGAYLAANEICRQVDVWGNAFAVARKIGAVARRERVAHYLADHYDSFVFAGQVRHLPEPEQWERMFKPIGAGTYQNGGYWGTPSGWLIEALHSVDRTLSERTLEQLLNAYRENGVLEWISPQGKRGPDMYVATIVNAWSLANQMRWAMPDGTSERREG